MMARIIDHTDSEIEEAVSALKAGKLVAIPTETVYGLGGNASIADAVEKIYTVKGRPSTDPLICHFDTVEKVVQVWDQETDPKVIELATRIGKALWPGPLTIVCKAHSSVIPVVTGGSGYVGARIPNHPVALKLLSKLDFPVAAPSANTFGHVSPTTAKHVYDDLASRDPQLIILNGGECDVGIESTVIKIETGDFIEVLRRGQISVTDIQEVLQETERSVRIEIRDTRSKFGNADTPMDGPGQLLSHYSPKVPAFLVTHTNMMQDLSSEVMVYSGKTSIPLKDAAIIDFGGFLKRFSTLCLAYRDLSSSASADDACHSVFDLLRWSENLAGVKGVVFPFLSEWTEKRMLPNELMAALEDRLFRAAAGKVATISV